jgi:Tfp pilus tip-associated adhesin PilY1
VDNTTQRIYGGDLQGNVWRFEVNDSLATTGLKLTTLTTGGATAKAQPITARLELAEIGGDPYVFAGTGRLLGTSDLTDTQLQSVYSFKDTNTAQGDLRSILKPMALTGTLASGIRTADCVTGTAAALCNQKTGWVIDLPESGERMTIDFKAGKGTLVFVTNVPAGDVCSNGHSWLNYVDMVSGKQISGATNASVLLDANSLGVGLGLVDVSGASGSSLKAIGVSANGQVAVKDIPFSTPPPVGKRISWREVVR